MSGKPPDMGHPAYEIHLQWGDGMEGDPHIVIGSGKGQLLEAKEIAKAQIAFWQHELQVLQSKAPDEKTSEKKAAPKDKK